MIFTRLVSKCQGSQADATLYAPSEDLETLVFACVPDKFKITDKTSERAAIKRGGADRLLLGRALARPPGLPLCQCNSN